MSAVAGPMDSPLARMQTALKPLPLVVGVIALGISTAPALFSGMLPLWAVLSHVVFGIGWISVLILRRPLRRPKSKAWNLVWTFPAVYFVLALGFSAALGGNGFPVTVGILANEAWDAFYRNVIET